MGIKPVVITQVFQPLPRLGDVFCIHGQDFTIVGIPERLGSVHPMFPMEYELRIKHELV